MARQDSVGLFWEDAARVVRLKQKGSGKKAKVKHPVPHPYWLEHTYLPDLDNAQRMLNVRRMTSADWQDALANNDWIVYDTECYQNYFAVGFQNMRTGKVDWVEFDDETPLNRRKVQWVIDNFTLVGFNTERYDEPMLAFALGGCDNEVLKACSDGMIVEKIWPAELLKKYRCHRVHPKEAIDLKEVAPGIQSLKTYGARLHTKRMQDLPFSPGMWLSREHKQIIRYYLCNDLTMTTELANKLMGEIKLRGQMSNQYGIDLLSKSDAQIAETVIRTMYERKTGKSATVPKIEPGEAYRFNVPAFLKYTSQTMRDVLEVARNTWFIVGPDGKIDLPPELKGLKITIGETTYTLGIGGLHSNEKSVSHYAGWGYTLMDADVASFYPKIIRNQKLYPKHLGPEFLDVYGDIVDTRLVAKIEGNKVVADSLKIVVNSSFGKFGNKYSILYAPDFLVQVTLTGQLSLLMLIDALNSAGIKVVSANTDGIVIKAHDDQAALRDKILAWWQRVGEYEMEYTHYSSIHSQNVNSYFAISTDKDGKSKVKRKGLFAKASLATTPSFDVCADAVEAYLAHGTPIADTIRNCNNVMDFVTVRNVSGGAVFVQPNEQGVYLGKVCRFYTSANDDNAVIYAKNGNGVPQSAGAVALMQTDSDMPDDIHYDAYIERANKILANIGVEAT